LYTIDGQKPSKESGFGLFIKKKRQSVRVLQTGVIASLYNSDICSGNFFY